MESITIKFTANGQTLTGGGLYCASNTVRYIIAEFDLGDNWQGYDSVRAVWSNDFKCISTVLDPSGSCTVPHEVLERRGKVSVNLVGSILEDDELTDRLTTYPVLAITVDANAKICGTETAEVTPSQFEQYVAIVIAEVEKVTGMTAVAHSLPEGSEPTANYSGGVLTLGIPKGDTGATGNGISGVEFNEDYSLTFYFTDSEPFTTPSIRGAQGARGYGIASVEKIGSAGLVDTYRINFEDPSVPPTTFTVTNGEEGPQGPRGYTGETGNGIESVYLTETHGAVKTYTILFTDGTTTTFDVTDGEVTLAELASVLPTDTASGAIASFEDGSDLFDYLSCIVDIEPVQAGSGTPSPDNVRPITGRTGCEVDVSGVNQWDEETRLGTYDGSTGAYNSGYSDRLCNKNPITVEPNTEYYFKYKSGTTGGNVYYYDASGAFISTQTNRGNLAFTTPNNCRSINVSFGAIYGTTYNHDISINYPSTDHDYHVYNGTTCPVSWQTEAGTVYGGTVDLVTGVLTVTEYGVDMGDVTFAKSGSTYGGFTGYLPQVYDCGKNTLVMISSSYAFDGVGNNNRGYYGDNGTFRYYYSGVQGTNNEVYIKNEAYGDATAGQFKTAMTGQKIVFPLATPQTYQLDPVQVACLLGRNNVWADCGDIEEVKYKADVQLYIDKMLNA